MGATPGVNKERKRELERQRVIDCGKCPYHKGDNARSGHDRERDDRYKDHRAGLRKGEVKGCGWEFASVWS
jgi:hypothetical protein